MKTIKIIATSLAVITLSACIGDNSTSSANTNLTTQSTINSCFSLSPAPTINGTQWWLSASVTLANTCSSAQSLSGVVFTLSNNSLSMNGSGFGMNTITPYDGSNSLSFNNQDNAIVITLNSSANLAANSSAQISFGGTPGLSRSPAANSFSIVLGVPAPSATPTANPTPTTIPTVVPTPLPLPTTGVTTRGTIYYHFYLPAGSLNGDRMVLDGDNYTDLIMSNIIAGSLLSRMIDETYPGIQYNKDYMIGSVWAQLLQENIDTAAYTHTSNNITPNGGAVMAGGQGGPYQLNNYAVDLIGTGAGRAMVNYVAIQANIGYPLGNPLTAVTPPIFNDKYFGPILTAYFHINDLIVIHLLGDGSLGYISTPVPDYIQCLEVSKTLPDSPFEVQMNYAYNAGFYAGLNQAAASMCVSNPTKYNQVYNDYANAAGSSYNQYPYQVRFYIDEMYNRAPGINSLNVHIAFNIAQLRTIFAKVIRSLAYTDKVGNYYLFTEAQANSAFDSALAAYSVPVTTTYDLSESGHRPAIYKILYGAFLNLENTTGFLFNTATKSQLIVLPSPTQSPTPTPTVSPTPSPVPSASPSPQPSASPSPKPSPSPSPSVAPVPSPTPSPVPTVSPSPVPTTSPTPAPAKTGTVTISMPTVVSAYNGNLQVQLLNAKASNAVVATYTIKQGSSVSSGNLPISDSTHAYKVKLVNGVADPLNGLNYIESGTPTVTVKNGQNASIAIPMKAVTTTKRTVTLVLSGLQGSDKATISFADASGKYNYVGYSGYGNGNAVFKIENNQNLTITVTTSSGAYQSASLSNSQVISANKTIALVFAAKPQPSPIPSPVPTVAPSPSPAPTVAPSPTPSPIASPTPVPSPSPSGVLCNSYTTWSSSVAYTGGDMVSYSGYVYKANWWTKGNNPASNNGGSGSGEEWLKIGACQ